MSRFDYIAERMAQASFETAPFKHLYIEDLFSEQDFRQVVGSPEVNIPPVAGDEELIAELYSRSFKEIEFPGTTTNIPAYLNWRKDPASFKTFNNRELCEGFGVTMRLQQTAAGSPLGEVTEYFRSESFWRVLAAKFGIDFDDVYTDFGLQKYLDGYEISPHPDIRRKALTFMVNINPAEHSESIGYHTHYLKLKPERESLKAFWNTHADIDRCWVPWEWCSSTKTQTRNNSVVVFAPSNDTIHAVKASYDHLQTQRTQFYGNLWFREDRPKVGVTWRDFEFDTTGAPSLTADKITAVQTLRRQQAQQKRPGDEIALVCKQGTFLKASTKHSAELSQEEKVALQPGDKLTAVIRAEIPDYYVVDDVAFKGFESRGRSWYVLKAHWREQEPLPNMAALNGRAAAHQPVAN